MFIRRPRVPCSLLFFALTVSAAIAQSPTLGACPILPADNIWNTAVDQLAVSPNSATWVGTIGSGKTLHPDFGAPPTIGMPYVAVAGTQTKYPVAFTYAGESDPGPYAIPLTAAVEGGSASTGDRHTLSIDTDNCILYELYYAFPQAASWNAGSGIIVDLRSDALRPAGWTSADAAGLPVFPGLVRYDEVLAGAINHAIRFTVPQTQNTYVWPARHEASSLTGTQYPPMGARFRLRAGFDISSYSRANQVILTALKKYGMMIADNGSSWFIQGVTDPRWNDSDLHNLGLIAGQNFEAVDVSGLMIDPNSGQATQATTTIVAVTPSTASVNINATQQFAATVTNATSQSVTWSVNGIAGGNSAVGLINSSGLYTAPSTVPSGGPVTVQATSTVAPTAIGMATVTITTPVQAPVLGSIAPNSGPQGSNVSVTLAGSNFQAGAAVVIGGTGVSATSVTVVSASQINAVFAIATGATTGAHGVTVSTSAGTSGAVTFTVNAVAAQKPTLSSLAPNAANRGSTVSVTLTGANFTSPASIAVQGSGVTVSNIVVVNFTTITATFHVGSSAKRQSRGTTVTTAAGTSNALSFTVQ